MAAGGAVNHRAGLYDAILIKENHIAAAGGIAEAVRARARGGAGARADARGRGPRRRGDRAGARRGRAAAAARQHGRRRSCARRSRRSRAAPSSRRAAASRCRRSGRLAETGVEWVSMGALTHSAPALDLSLILELARLPMNLPDGLPTPPMAAAAGRRPALAPSEIARAEASEVRALAGRAQRGDPRAQLPGARGPGRGRLRRRLARALAPGGGGRRRDDRLLRRALHGRDGLDPVPGEDRADPRPRRRLLAGGLDRRRAARRWRAQYPTAWS